MKRNFLERASVTKLEVQGSTRHNINSTQYLELTWKRFVVPVWLTSCIIAERRSAKISRSLMQCCNKNILRKIRIYMNPVMHKGWDILKLFKFLYVCDIYCWSSLNWETQESDPGLYIFDKNVNFEFSNWIWMRRRSTLATRAPGWWDTFPDPPISIITLACERTLRGALAAGRENEGELAITSLEFESHLQFPVVHRGLSCLKMSANQREAETRANVNNHWKTCAKGNDVTTFVISANQHFTSTFSMQIFKFQRRSCKLSFIFPPCRRAARRSLLAGYDNVLQLNSPLVTGDWKKLANSWTAHSH